jgi:hypothetical protein
MECKVAETFETDTRRNIRMALARDAYARNSVRMADNDIADFPWLVASHKGVFAAHPDGVKTIIHGWFFGIHRHDDKIYLFENCAMRDMTETMGRLVRLTLFEGRLIDPTVLATGLHNNCHQLAVIDDRICVVDTANQQILRFAMDGTPVDIKRPFPVASSDDRSGAYLHLNAIAKIGERIGLMLHNGKAVPAKRSELVWLGSDWTVLERHMLDGHNCHDIVKDDTGLLWHSASMTGEIMASDGQRVKVSDELMTRGIAFSADHMIVGVSSFGPRQIRHSLPGQLIIMDRRCKLITSLPLNGPPTDIVAI